MRYFLLAFFLLTVLTVGIAGFRGSMSRRPPIEVFPDMDRQPKIRPQTASRFFTDQLSSRLPVPGTIARSKPYQNLAATNDPEAIYPYQESPITTGHLANSTNWIENNPFKVSAVFLARGQQRFQIYCLPCHGALGDGKGITTKYGMAPVANFHDPRIVRMADGEIFNTITYGSKSQLMGPYGPLIGVQDRWAIISYLRALQLARLGAMDDVPVSLRSRVRTTAPPAGGTNAPAGGTNAPAGGANAAPAGATNAPAAKTATNAPAPPKK